MWLPFGQSYKFVLSPATDSDPPTNPFWTADNAGVGLFASSIRVAGSTVVPTNSAMFINTTRTGTSTTPLTVPLVYINDTESITDTAPANNGIASLYVGKSFGSGEGVRIGIMSFMSNTAPTAGGPATDGNQFYTSIFGANAVRSTDGGNNSSYRGDFYGVASYTIGYSGSTFLHGILGAEFDGSINTGASAKEFMLLQLALINNHAVHGVSVDSGIVITADNTVLTGLNCGICFGKPAPYQVWPIAAGGTMIGAYVPVAAPVATRGIDWSAVSFTDCAWFTVGVCLDFAGGGNIRLTHGNPEIRWNDTLGVNTSGALARISGLGSANQFQWQNNSAVAGDFSSVNVVFTIDGQNFRVGPVTALSTSATAGFLGLPTSNGVPTGVPVGAGGGYAPIEVDTANNHLCYYNGGWRCL